MKGKKGGRVGGEMLKLYCFCVISCVIICDVRGCFASSFMIIGGGISFSICINMEGYCDDRS